MRRNKNVKIGLYAAHDDDAVLASGGRIVQHLNKGNEVYIVIFADGRNSHKSVLGIKKNPAAWEVKAKRREEMEKAASVLGLSEDKLYFLDLSGKEGRVWQNRKEAYKKALKITEKEKPDIIYFHHPDAHRDHRAVSEIVFKILKKLKIKTKAYQFFIWTKELAKGRPEVCSKDASEVKKNVFKVDIRKQLEIKRKALYKMKSQILKKPYKSWQAQKAPILDKSFIDYFLRGEEIFIKTSD